MAPERHCIQVTRTATKFTQRQRLDGRTWLNTIVKWHEFNFYESVPNSPMRPQSKSELLLRTISRSVNVLAAMSILRVNSVKLPP